MNQLKPFTFWIVLGVILFAELVWWVLSIPDLDIVGNKAKAQEMQNTLKQEYKHLTELERRGRNASPLGVFDAEKPDDIRRLTDDYLITPAWKEVLDPHVQGYDKQLKAIKERLVARSKHLHEPIAASNDKFGWYTAYQNASEEQLKKLAAAGALVITAEPSKPISRVPGTDPAAASTEKRTLDFANDATLRAQAGFFTKGADLPDAGEYPVLTRQFRTMELIISIITETVAANAPNPLVNIPDAPVASPSGIVSVTWDSIEPTLGSEVGSYAEAWHLSLTLQGSVTALLTTTAALEHPRNDQSPIFVITGGELTRKTAFLPGERKDVGSEMATARIELLVLDFTNALTGVKHTSETTAGNGAPTGVMMPPPEQAPPPPSRPAASRKPSAEEEPQ
jgi:hypothetical protein